MLVLKQLACQLELATSNTPLTIYKPHYTDGVVQAFIAVPTEPLAFSIRMVSSGFIAPGLAMFVFIDGEYQCNRNKNCKAASRDPGPEIDPQDYALQFYVRQKEQKDSSGRFIGRDWTFEELKIANANKAKTMVEKNIREVGTINVVVLRVGNQGTYVPSPVAPPRMPSQNTPKHTRGQSVSSVASKRSSKASSGLVDPFGGISGIFDGAMDLDMNGVSQCVADSRCLDGINATQDYSTNDDQFAALGDREAATDFNMDGGNDRKPLDQNPYRQYREYHNRSYDWYRDDDGSQIGSNGGRRIRTLSTAHSTTSPVAHGQDHPQTVDNYSAARPVYQMPSMDVPQGQFNDNQKQASASAPRPQPYIPGRVRQPRVRMVGPARVGPQIAYVKLNAMSFHKLGINAQKVIEHLPMNPMLLDLDFTKLKEHEKIMLQQIYAMPEHGYARGQVDTPYFYGRETVYFRLENLHIVEDQLRRVEPGQANVDGQQREPLWNLTVPGGPFSFEQYDYVTAPVQQPVHQQAGNVAPQPQPIRNQPVYPQQAYGQQTPASQPWQTPLSPPQEPRNLQQGYSNAPQGSRNVPVAYEQPDDWPPSPINMPQAPMDVPYGPDANGDWPEMPANMPQGPASNEWPESPINMPREPDANGNWPGVPFQTGSQRLAFGDPYYGDPHMQAQRNSGLNKAVCASNARDRQSAESKAQWAPQSSKKSDHAVRWGDEQHKADNEWANGGDGNNNDNYNNTNDNNEWSNENEETKDDWGNGDNAGGDGNAWATAGDDGQHPSAQVDADGGWGGNEPAVSVKETSKTATDLYSDNPIKPHWADWRKVPTNDNVSPAAGKKRFIPRNPYVYPAEPLPTIPEAGKTSATHGVRAGPGAVYEHKCRRPVYLDSLENPYAVFAFKYRSKEILEDILGHRIEINLDPVLEQAQKDKYLHMPKEVLVDKLMAELKLATTSPTRIEKTSKGGNWAQPVADAGNGWNDQAKSDGSSSKSHFSKSSSSKKGGGNASGNHNDNANKTAGWAQDGGGQTGGGFNAW